MSARSGKRPATYADILAAPVHSIAEIVGGVLYTQPRPASPHANVSSSLGIEIGGPFGRGRGGPGGWHILDEPELHLGEDVIVPDLAGWRHERMPKIPRVPFFTLAPDWICEVLSPSTSKVDRKEKLPVYAREGVRHAWIIDPEAKTLEALRLEGSRWMLLGAWGGADVARIEPFDAIELELVTLWLED